MLRIEMLAAVKTDNSKECKELEERADGDQFAMILPPEEGMLHCLYADDAQGRANCHP
jgi:hypothetical protein